MQKIKKKYESNDEFLKLGFIKESVSAWSASVLLIKKKDGTKRFVVEYRHLHKDNELLKFSELENHNILSQ